MSLFKSPSELEVTQVIKVLIYGQPGLGKSTLALSAPFPVLLDFDGGVHRVNGAFHCPTLQVKSWNEVILALKEDLSPFQTLVIDTAGKMLDYMSAFLIKNDSKYAMRDGSLTLNGYGARKVMFINFLKQCEMMGKNLVFVAHEKEEKDGDQHIIRPEIGGSSAGDLIKELDLVGYMQAVGNERAVYWTPQEKFYAKNTCNLPPMVKIPTIINPAGGVIGQNSFLAQTFESYKQCLIQQSQIKDQYHALLDVVRVKLDSVVDSDSANEIKDDIIGLEHIWDSKIKAGLLLNEKCKELGLKLNRETKRYESVEN
ncbi:MAG: ATP-binding protein [Tannerellaceae bacterium]|nr:ATP-binding protein [Tannerellaceae bacterium]